MKNMKRKAYSLVLLAVIGVGLVLTIYNVISWFTYLIILLFVGFLINRK